MPGHRHIASTYASGDLFFIVQLKGPAADGGLGGIAAYARGHHEPHSAAI
jgi:hypothetical protein